MTHFANPALLRADLWACRLALVLETLLIAWMAGRAAAGDPGAPARLAAVGALAAVSVLASLAVHGRTLVGLRQPRS